MSGKRKFFIENEHLVISIVLSIRSQWFRLYNPIVCEIENNEFDRVVILFIIHRSPVVVAFFPSPVFSAEKKTKQEKKTTTARWLLYWQTNVSLRSCFGFIFELTSFYDLPFSVHYTAFNTIRFILYNKSFFTISVSHSLSFIISQYFDF